MDKIELKVILEQHKLWLEDNSKGKRANLRGADLRDADLYGADLSNADLTSANLGHTNLYSANLRHANLRHANLYSANLGHANLRHANLSRADLRGANLRFTKGIVSFISGNHLAFFTPHNNYLKIGCEGHDLDHWIENFEQIGLDRGYTREGIRLYSIFIKALTEV